MRVLFFLLLCTNFLQALGQETQQAEYKYTYYFGANFSNALGSYKTVLKEGNKSGTKVGYSGGFMVNPYGRKRASPVSYGGEIGFHGDGEESVKTSYYNYFKATNVSLWANGMTRYRPVSLNSRFNPYADAFFGAKIIQTSLKEVLDGGEMETLKRWTKVTPNYGLGIGVGIKLFKSIKKGYIDIGIYYQQAEATKIVKPNTIEVDTNFEYKSKQVLTTTNQWIIKLGVTGFN